MNLPLRTLLVEDSENDAELLLGILRSEGFELHAQRVQTANELRQALRPGAWDVVLCDNAMPHLNAKAALAIVQESGLDLPVIIVSGAMGEEEAVTRIKEGAADYLLKDRLSRLGQAVRQAVAQQRERQERRRTEEALRTAQETVQTIFDSAPVAIFALDLAGRVTKWSAGAARLFGWNEAEVIGRLSPSVPVDDLEEFRAMIERVIRCGPQTGMIYRRQKKNGQVIHANLSSAPLRNPAGEVVGLMVIIEDISERIQAQQALERSEREQRQLARQLAEEKDRLIAAQAVAKVGSWETDLATGTVRWSDETHRIFETDPRTFQPTHEAFLRRVHPDDRHQVDEAFFRSLASPVSVAMEHRIPLADGRLKVVEERWRVFIDDEGRASRVVGTCQDITERKWANEALRESEDRFRTIFEQAGIGIALVDPADGHILRCNRTLADFLGYTEAELGDLTVRAVSDPADYADDRQQWERMLAGEIPRFQMEKRYRRKAGQVVWGLLTSTVVRDVTGRSLYIIGMVEDITERRQVEESLKESEQRFAGAFEHAPIGLALVSPEGRYLKVNRALCELLGYRAAELCTLTFQELTAPEDLEKGYEQARRLFAGEISSFQMEKRYLHADGHLVTALLSVSLVRDGDGKVIYQIAQIQDISARKRAEAELRSNEEQLHSLVARLNTVREEEAKRIARELHDDLGQRLTALNMELSALEADGAEGSPAFRERAVRMQAIVDHTIVVVQKIAGELRLGQLDVLGLTAAIDWQMQEFSRLSAIPCRAPRLDEVEGLSDVQSTTLFRILQEALTNIIRHAGASAVEVSLESAPDHVTLTVRDNGRGITESELMNRNAIGLLGMRERAQLVGGVVTISGQPGAGTVVCVRIPRVATAPKSA